MKNVGGEKRRWYRNRTASSAFVVYGGNWIENGENQENPDKRSRDFALLLHLLLAPASLYPCVEKKKTKEEKSQENVRSSILSVQLQLFGLTWPGYYQKVMDVYLFFEPQTNPNPFHPFNPTFLNVLCTHSTLYFPNVLCQLVLHLSQLNSL